MPTSSMITGPVTRGEPIPQPMLGRLRASPDRRGDASALRARLAQDGYVYLPGLFVRDEILAARQAVFERLAEVGEIAEPVIDGIATGTSQRRERCADLGAFWRSVSETWALRRITHGARLHRLMDDLLEGESRPQDYIFLRPAGPGKHTRVHCDAGFFTRTTERVLTAWIALGDTPLSDGPLFVIEGSHRFADVLESQRGFDVVRDTGRQAAFAETALELAASHDARVLSEDYGAGDVVVFSMYLLHGAFDNMSPVGRVRLSCDVRYQHAADPVDERYFGPEPLGTTGAGYGELVGAKPLTEEWHVR